jgi:hypothetical protein
MTRPRRIPVRGDVAASVVAEVLGLSLTDFEARRPHCVNAAFLSRTRPPGFIASKLWTGGACAATHVCFPS